MYTTTTKARHFTCCIEAGQGLTICLQNTTRKIGFNTSQGFARQDRQPDCDQRSSGGIEDAMWLRNTYQLVADVVPCPTDGRDLSILSIGIGDLTIAVNDDAFKIRQIDQRLFRQIIHSLHQFWQGRAYDKVYPMLLKCLNWSWRTR